MIVARICYIGRMLCAGCDNLGELVGYQLIQSCAILWGAGCSVSRYVCLGVVIHGLWYRCAGM